MTNNSDWDDYSPPFENEKVAGQCGTDPDDFNHDNRCFDSITDDQINQDPKEVYPVKKSLALSIEEWDSEPLIPQTWLIEDWIEDESKSAVWGASNVGKTFVMIDVAGSVATGTPFMGKETRQGYVIYVAGEGRRGVRKRIQAWSSLKYKIPSDRLLLANRSISLSNHNLVDELKKLIDSKLPEPPSLIIIDTWNRNLGEYGENDNDDTAAAMSKLELLQLAYPGLCFIVVHHSGVNEGHRMKGAGALRNALDQEFSVKENNGQKIITCEKMREGEYPEPMAFQLMQYEFREEGLRRRNGDFETSAVCKQVELSGNDSPDMKPSVATQAGKLFNYIAENGPVEMRILTKKFPTISNVSSVVNKSKFLDRTIHEGVTQVIIKEYFRDIR